MGDIEKAVCVVCQEPIGSMYLGQFCPQCKKAIHFACKLTGQQELTCGYCNQKKVSRPPEPAETTTVQEGPIILEGEKRVVPQPKKGIVFHFSLTGRIRRRQYVLNALLNVVFFMFIMLAFGAIHELVSEIIFQSILWLLIALFSWNEMANAVKRLHDTNRSGWQYLLLSVPFYNIYLGLVLLLQKGTVGDNRFGPDPRQR